MIYRWLSAVAALLLSAGIAQAVEAKAPKAEPSASGSTADPMDVPRGMRDWFAKSVDDILGDDERPAQENHRGHR